MAIQGRPKKVRYIQSMPKTLQFSPRGRPGRPEEVELSIDQFEAFKLADFQGFNQSEGAVAMQLSRPSFGRLLREARRLIADGLVNGKIIKIHQGDVQIGVRKVELTSRTFREELDKFKQRNKKMLKDIRKAAVPEPIWSGKTAKSPRQA